MDNAVAVSDQVRGLLIQICAKLMIDYEGYLYFLAISRKECR
jgi:hypothetical protein